MIKDFIIYQVFFSYWNKLVLFTIVIAVLIGSIPFMTAHVEYKKAIELEMKKDGKL